MSETNKDLENIKSRLIEHINKTYPLEKAQEFSENINSMNNEEFMFFLKEQGLIKDEKSSPTGCIFCSIVFGEIPSTKIGENSKAIAILDIKPASLGHSLIIPKEHIESRDKLPPEVGKLAEEIQNKLKKAFNPKRIDLISTNIMGHEILNVLPIYKEEKLEQERKNLTGEELEKIKEKIEIKNKEEPKIKKEENVEKSKKEINDKNTWLPKRIP